MGLLKRSQEYSDLEWFREIPYFLKNGPGTLEIMTSSDGETIQGGTLFKGGHYFPSPFFIWGN